VQKHYAANKFEEKKSRGPGAHVQPVYVSMGSFDEWSALTRAVAGGVAPYAPTVHNCFLADTLVHGSADDLDGNVLDTWVFAHVDDATIRASRDYEAAPTACQYTVWSNTFDYQHGHMQGNAFTSCHLQGIDAGVALALTIVARYSRLHDVIWDLRRNGRMRALPMAAIGLDRKYVRMASKENQAYENMVSTLYEIDFLKTTCGLLWDGKWEGETTHHWPLTVSIPPHA
jgi:hypothetical protein